MSVSAFSDRLGPLRLGLVAALAAVSFLVAAGTATAAPGLVTVKVTIDKVSAIDCFEGTVPLTGLCLGEADFYAIVSIDGFEFPQTDAIDDQNNADPNPDWVFERQIDITRGRVPVVIEIRDEDGGLRLGDDHADIDPTNGGDPFNLDLLVRLSPSCEVTGDATLSTEQCGTIVTSTGTASSNKARIFYKIEVIDPDSDGDWLPDSWENGGLDADGDGTIDVDLPAMGAHPQRKDLFLELDCLEVPGGHSHCPVQGAIRSVVQSFADAPVSNPDGTQGIQLHVDVGSLYGQAAGADTKVTRTGASAATGSYGNYGRGGDKIDETGNEIVDWDGATGRPATSFYALKGGNFDDDRKLAFRYGLFVHQVNARQASNDCTSGWAEGGVDGGTSRPGNDLIVSLGGTNDGGALCWGGVGGQSVGTQAQQAGTLMHELGHTLGLDHGGGDELNNKPNYLSVMNYSFQACGVPASPTPGLLPGGCDFSRRALLTLEERLNAAAMQPGLDECAGFDGGVYGFGGVNWNGAGGLTGASCTPPSANVSANVNGDFNDMNNNGTQDDGEASIFGQLPGFDDWANIRYDFREQGNFADGSVPPFPNEANPQIIASARAFLAALLKPTLAVDKTGPPDAIPGDTLNYELDVENTGNGPAVKTVLRDTKPDASQVSFDLGTAVVGASFTRSATFDVPCDTADGATLTNRATATAEDILGNTVSGTDSVTTTVHAPVLTLEKSASPSVNAGEAITYRLTYENVGSGDAESVQVTDVLPADVYYSVALDLGTGPKPTTVTPNADGTTTLAWQVGDVAAGADPATIEYTARPSLFVLAGATLANSARLTFTNANGCTYDPVTASARTTVTAVSPTRNPLSQGYWKTHPAERTSEILARIQATDQRFDGADGSAANGALSSDEVGAVFAAGGTPANVLPQQLLATYFNLATRRINASTAIRSKTTLRLGLANVRDAALYAIGTLALPVAGNNARYSDAILVLDEINQNKSERY